MISSESERWFRGEAAADPEVDSSNVRGGYSPFRIGDSGSMKYLAVRCRSCEKEFAVERIDNIRQAIQFLRPSFRASYTCPHCGAAADYASVDLTHYDGDVESGPSATSR